MQKQYREERAELPQQYKEKLEHSPVSTESSVMPVLRSERDYLVSAIQKTRAKLEDVRELSRRACDDSTNSASETDDESEDNRRDGESKVRQTLRDLIESPLSDEVMLAGAAGYIEEQRRALSEFEVKPPIPVVPMLRRPRR